jgi:hypothetical protein
MAATFCCSQDQSGGAMSTHGGGRELALEEAAGEGRGLGSSTGDSVDGEGAGRTGEGEGAGRIGEGEGDGRAGEGEGGGRAGEGEGDGRAGEDEDSLGEGAAGVGEAADS